MNRLWVNNKINNIIELNNVKKCVKSLIHGKNDFIMSSVIRYESDYKPW